MSTVVRHPSESDQVTAGYVGMCALSCFQADLSATVLHRECAALSSSKSLQALPFQVSIGRPLDAVPSTFPNNSLLGSHLQTSGPHDLTTQAVCSKPHQPWRAVCRAAGC